MFKKELEFYKDAPIAVDYFHQFQVCGQLEGTDERWPVVGEVGYEWLEMHEVGTYFNADDDGAFYYIGDADCNPLRPPLRELQESNHYNFEHGPCLYYSEKLAWHLSFKGEES